MRERDYSASTSQQVWSHVEEEINSTFQVVKKIYNKPKNLHVALLCRKWPHSVSVWCKQSSILLPLISDWRTGHSWTMRNSSATAKPPQCCILCQPSQCRKTDQRQQAGCENLAWTAKGVACVAKPVIAETNCNDSSWNCKRLQMKGLQVSKWASERRTTVSTTASARSRLSSSESFYLHIVPLFWLRKPLRTLF